MKKLLVALLFGVAIGSFPGSAQVGTLDEIIQAVRDGRQPQYLAKLMWDFRVKLTQFVIDNNVHEPKEILNLFGTMVSMMTHAHDITQNVGCHTGLPDDHVTLSFHSSFYDACKVLENAWMEIVHEGFYIKGPESDGFDFYPRTFLIDVSRESLEQYAREMEGEPTDQPLVVRSEFVGHRIVQHMMVAPTDGRLALRYRFVEWRILNRLLEDAERRLGTVYIYPRFKKYEGLRPTRKHPFRGVITNPMDSPGAWLAFRTKHFDSLPHDVWLFLAPWVGVIDALVFGPAIVQFNVGRLSESSPLQALPREVFRIISMFVAPPLFRK